MNFFAWLLRFVIECLIVFCVCTVVYCLIEIIRQKAWKSRKQTFKNEFKKSWPIILTIALVVCLVDIF